MNTNFLREKSPFVQASFLSLGEKVNFSNRYLDIYCEADERYTLCGRLPEGQHTGISKLKDTTVKELESLCLFCLLILSSCHQKSVCRY